MTEPHYLRFARALTLVSMIGGCAATTPESDAGTDAAALDAVVALDIGPRPAYCDTCTCCGHDSGTGTDLPSCPTACCPWGGGDGGLICGPLAPPDLAA